MKLLVSMLLIVLYFQCNLSAQDFNQFDKPIKIYRTWVALKYESIKINGVLYQIKDSVIVVSSSVERLDYSLNRFETIDLNIENINSIKVRRKNSIGMGALFGTLTGFVVGGMIGFISGDDPPVYQFPIYFPGVSAEQKAIAFGVIGGISGGLLGALIGSVSVVIPINTSFTNYNQNKTKLKKYAINKD